MLPEPATLQPVSAAPEATTEPSRGPLDALVEEALAPIRDEAPGGDDLTYEPAFEEIKAQIDRLNTVDARIDQERALQGESLVADAASGPDFAAVAASAQALLRERTKDFRLAGYLALALTETDALPGMAAGLRVLAGLTERYWPDAYPPPRRLRGRLALFAFVSQQLGRRLEAIPAAAADRPALEAARAAIDRIHTALERHTGEATHHLLSLQVGVDERLRRLPAPEPPASAHAAAPEPATPPEPSAPAPPPARPGATTPEPPPSAPVPAPPAPEPLAEARTPPEALRAVLQACTVLRDAQPTGALAFRLARSVRWEGLDALPPHTNGTTRIEAPPARRRDYLRRLTERGEWATLLQEGEAAFCEHPYQFWLDLQRLLVGALEAAGPAYASARAVVADEATRLATRLPGLAGLAYSDGTPFADPATRQWLEALARVPGDQPAAAGEDDATAEVLAEAEQHAADGALGRGARVLQEAAAQAASDRARFRLELALARLFAEAGRPEMARPLLDALDRESSQRGLDHWEPALALDVAALRFRCLVALGRAGPGDRAETEEARAERSALFARLCRLDAQRALALETWAGGAG